VIPSRVIIVDHGTRSLQLDRRWPFPVEILKRSSSLWFTAATNAGLNHARLNNPTFLAILNDDVVLGSNDWLAQMVKLATEPDTIVASTALDERERVLYAGIRLRAATFSYRNDDRDREYGEIDKSPRDCDVLPTRGIVFQTSIWDRIGPLNEAALPHYASDYEWTARAKQQGMRLQMARCVYLTTRKTTSAQRPPQCLSKELADYLCSRHLKGSFPVACAYATSVFNQPYRCGFVMAHFLRFSVSCALRQLKRVIYRPRRSDRSAFG
jgi:GT2 family glycosyltransferase